MPQQINPIKNEDKEYVQQLELLVEELLNDDAKETSIKAKMVALGIEYCDDPVERINRVLKALHPSEIADDLSENLDFE